MRAAVSEAIATPKDERFKKRYALNVGKPKSLVFHLSDELNCDEAPEYMLVLERIRKF